MFIGCVSTTSATRERFMCLHLPRATFARIFMAFFCTCPPALNYHNIIYIFDCIKFLLASSSVPHSPLPIQRTGVRFDYMHSIYTYIYTHIMRHSQPNWSLIHGAKLEPVCEPHRLKNTWSSPGETHRYSFGPCDIQCVDGKAIRPLISGFVSERILFELLAVDHHIMTVTIYHPFKYYTV